MAGCLFSLDCFWPAGLPCRSFQATPQLCEQAFAYSWQLSGKLECSDEKFRRVSARIQNQAAKRDHFSRHVSSALCAIPQLRQLKNVPRNSQVRRALQDQLHLGSLSGRLQVRYLAAPSGVTVRGDPLCGACACSLANDWRSRQGSCQGATTPEVLQGAKAASHDSTFASIQRSDPADFCELSVVPLGSGLRPSVSAHIVVGPSVPTRCPRRKRSAPL